MPSIDDQLRTRMREAVQRPVGADDLVAHLGARKRRRAMTRKVGTVTLVIAVLAGTVGGFAALGNAFRTTPQTPAGPQVGNGDLVVNITNEDAFWLSVLPRSKQDLTPGDGAVAVDREQMRGLVGSTGSDRDVQPAVSPDGTTVAFVHHDFKGPGSLWRINLDGSKSRRLVPDDVDVSSPAWSADGNWIAFGAARVEGQPLGFVRPDGTDLVYPRSPVGAGQPSWSPDGSQLVFSALSSTDPSGVSHDLWVAGFDPELQILTGLRQLTSTDSVDETDPVWSPDGTSIDFVNEEGIEQIPAGGGPAETLVPAFPLGDGRSPTSPAWSPDGAFLTFVLEAPLLAATVYAMRAGGSQIFPLAQGFDFAWQPVPSSSSPDLGFGFPTCRVMSMPLSVAGTAGTAFVVSEVAGSCPKAGEGQRYLGADLDGDGVIDTEPVQLTGCFPPVGCETFAAPDVNGDGTSEVAVSEAGADGYGVRLFALTTSPPAIEPIVVVDPQGIGNVQTGPLQFAWVDVVGHAELARCDTAPDGATFTVHSVDHLPPDAVVRSTVLRVDGTVATVIDATKERVAIGDAPAPGNTLCDGPIYGSASNFPQAPPGQDGTNIGLDAPLCNISDMTADLTGDQQPDGIWVGTQVQQDGRCPDTYDATNVVAVDVTGDGLADTSSTAIAYCVSCAPFGTIDFDADGRNELVVTEQAGSETQYGIFAVRPTGESGRLEIAPVLVADPGDPSGGFDAGKPFTFWAGGDEGRDEFVRCDSYPAAPVMVLSQTSHPIDGPGSDTKTVHVTRLELQADGLIHVVGVDEYTQPTSDPLTFPTPTTACGLRLDLYL